MLQFLIDTILRASDLALVALGLSLLFGMAKFPNVAHVQYAMLGAYVTYACHAYGIPLLGALMVGSFTAGLATLLLQALLFQRLLQGGPAIAMIGSLAVSMLIIAAIQGFAGSFPRMFNLPRTSSLVIGGVHVAHTQVYLVATTAMLLAAFIFLLFRTGVGRAIRALSNNPMLANATGLDATRMTHGVAFASGAIAGLGGSMLALSTGAHINLGNDLLLPVFAAVILGGLGNPVGAVFGALLIALTETVVTNVNFGPVLGRELAFMPASYISAASFLMLLLTLLLKPYGIFDREVRRV